MEERLDKVKNEIAMKHGYGKYWVALSLDEKALLTDEVAEEYARQCCEEQIKACAKEATASIDYVDFYDFSKGIEGCHVDEYSILETPNVVTSKNNG